MHLKLPKSLEGKKVTKKGEYYFPKGFKVLLSCAKKKYTYNEMKIIQIIRGANYYVGVFEVLRIG